MGPGRQFGPAGRRGLVLPVRPRDPECPVALAGLVDLVVPVRLGGLADTGVDRVVGTAGDTDVDILPWRAVGAVVGNFHIHRNTDCMTFLLLYFIFSRK